MVNLLLYATSVLTLGTSFLAIKWQLDVVSPIVSVSYRFAIASAILVAFCLIRGRSLRFRARDHGRFALQGVMVFSTSQSLVYFGTQFLTSGVVAVLFSTMTFMNILNGAAFFGLGLRPRVVAGTAIGFAGVTLVSWPEMAALSLTDAALLGLGLCLAGTYVASLGNMVAARNQSRGLPIVETIAFSMGYGALVAALYALALGHPFDFEPTARYAGALAYSAVVTAVIGFWAYLTLLGRIGPDRAAYTVILFPPVALLVSTWLESYVWTAAAALGIVLTLAGNVLVLAPARGSGGRGTPWAERKTSGRR